MRYSPTTETLEVTLGGRVYHYFKVPATVAHELVAASSVGVNYNAVLKGRYKGRRLGKVKALKAESGSLEALLQASIDRNNKK